MLLGGREYSFGGFLVGWFFSNIKIKFKPGCIHALENLPLMETALDQTHKTKLYSGLRFTQS